MYSTHRKCFVLYVTEVLRPVREGSVVSCTGRECCVMYVQEAVRTGSVV